MEAHETPTELASFTTDGGFAVRSRRLASATPDGAPAALAERLAAFAHPGVAPIARALVHGGALFTAERTVAGTPLTEDGKSPFADKALAVGTELARALDALAEAGLAHGEVEARHVVRTDDGPVLVGTTGLRADGTLAEAADDARALAALVLSLLDERAPDAVRSRLEALGAAPPAAGQLLRTMAAARAAIPVSRHRHVRSIQRLAFPPPKKSSKKKRNWRYARRVVLALAAVVIGLVMLFEGTGTTIAKEQRPSARRDTPGVVYVHLPPLRATSPTPTGPSVPDATP